LREVFGSSQKLQILGCQEVQRKVSGSHRKWKNPINAKSTVVPDWGPRDLKLGTIRAVVRQLGLTWQDFSGA
jgi:mRNA interferase HicA